MSIPYAGEEFTFHNPNGSEIKVRGWGDQSAAVFETLDGYTVVKDPISGFYHYATLSADATSLVSIGIPVGRVAAPETLGLPRNTRIPAAAVRAGARAANDVLGGQRRWQTRREQKRAQLRRLADADNGRVEAAPPPAGTTGNYIGLCLLVQFPDVPGTISQGQVENFCNQPGYSEFGNNGSVSDYFETVSDRKLHYTNRVTAYYTTQQPRAHYTDPNIGYGIRAQELIAEALAALTARGFDFSALSSDAAGFVYALNVFYAGTGMNNWAEGLWPHASALATKYIGSPTKTFSDYQITDMGAQLTLRTFCHENGHMICDFPDLYDKGNESFGIGHYCLMCYGGSDTNPTQVGAYLKNAAGWASKTTKLLPGMTATVGAGINDFLIPPGALPSTSSWRTASSPDATRTFRTRESPSGMWTTSAATTTNRWCRASTTSARSNRLTTVPTWREEPTVATSPICTAVRRRSTSAPTRRPTATGGTATPRGSRSSRSLSRAPA
jgi:M6 family metalloprotease-like protein